MHSRRRIAFGTILLSDLAMALLWPACSDDGTTTPRDTTPPASVTDLAVQSTTATSVTLRWTAPGDDGTNGRAAAYDLRHAPGEPSSFVWTQATAVTGLAAPLAAGATETFTVTGLTSGSRYSFALMTADEAPNWSAMSNVVSATPGDGATGCQVSPTSLAFGAVAIGSSSERTFTITNAGTQPLSGAIVESCDDFTVTGGGGAYTLNGGETRTVTVRYAPTAAGSHSCTIEIGPSGCDDVTCTGTGVSAPSGEMILIPAGPFTMGSDQDEGGTYEEPEHRPNLSAYYIDKYEVSNAAYAQALNWANAHGLVAVSDWTGPYGIVHLTSVGEEVLLYMDEGAGENQCRITWDGSTFGVESGWENHPVVYVTWWGAAAYCNWRSAAEGKPVCYNPADWSCDFDAGGYRLPTEAEWEKAARGSTDERTYPWGDGIDCGRCNYSPGGGPCRDRTAPVDDPEYSDGVSPYGVWQMGGNVWEWCHDWYQDEYYASSPADDPRGPATATGYRCSRGGSWWDSEYHSRCANRGWDDPVNHFDRLGFRSALPAQQTVGCQVAPTSLTFPETPVGSSVERSFTITNNGSGALTGSLSEGCEHFSLTSGGGSYSLGAGQSRTVTVRYAPTAAGAHACTIETGASACSDVSCVGTATGGGGPGCSISPTSIDFAATAVGDHKESSFTITNNGSTALSGAVTENCPHFSIPSGGGAYTLSPGQQRSVVVRFEPTAAGSHSCTVETGDAACSDVICAGTATGGGPGCTVNPTALTFPQTNVGAYGELAFVIVNGGSTDLSGSVTESCEHFRISIGGGAYTLPPGQRRTVVVRYEPTSAGAHGCVIETGNGACSDVACTGTAVVSVPGCNVNPSYLNFPDTPIGSSVELSFQIQNDGSQSVSGHVSTAGCGEFSVTAGGGAYAIAPGRHHTVTVRYAPTTHGTHTCVVETGAAGCIDVACAGTSVEVHPECFVWPRVILNFSPQTVGGSEEQTFNVQNVSSGTLSGVISESCEHYELASGGGAYSLSPGQSRAVVVRYAPTAAGTHVCEIDTGTGCTNVGCTGVATAGGGAGQCSVDPAALVFPETAVGTSSDLTFTIRNSGAGGTLTGSVTESCAHFSLVSGEGAYSLGAGEERIVTVRYTPTQAGQHNCTVDTGISCAPVACSGTTAAEPPRCEVQPATLSFGEISVGATADQDFTISNVGGGTLTGNATESCPHFSLVAGGGAYALAAGESRTVTVRYAPTAAGTHNCTVDLGGALCPDISCSGTAVEEPGQCRIEPSALAFGTVPVGSTADLDFTIFNDGAGTLNGSVTESCPHFSIPSGGGAFSLAAGASRTVTVRYAPTAVGAHSCSIDLGSSCRDVGCTGTGGSAPEENMVLIPAGSFTMGSDEDEGTPNERPEHQVSVSAFYMDRYEVTNAQYAEALNWARARNLVTVDNPDPIGIVYLVGGGQEPCLYMDDASDENNQCRITWDGSTFAAEPGWEDHPVVYVTWWGAASYCNWRSGMAGRTPCYRPSDWTCDFSANGYRLPTEAEWERASRGGNDERTFPWGDEAVTCERANFLVDPAPCVGTTARVDDPEYADGVSPFGVWQLSGNVWEWCNDWFDDLYYASSPGSDPTGPAGTAYRVSRGGSWWDGEYWQRCAVRGADDPINHFDRLGLRAVRR